MITHVALYRGLTETTAEPFATALAAATEETGLAAALDCGPHVPLPADGAVPHAVWSFAASWSFATPDVLDAFSQHPAMQRFVAEWVSRLELDVAFANYGAAEPARLAVVTGAASGIGAAVAHSLSAAGMTVAMLDRDPHVHELEGAGRLPFVVDVADRAAVEEAVASAVDAAGPIEAVVTCAAVMRELAPPAEVAREDWDAILAVNLFGTVNACQAAIPHMNAGAIVTTASIVGTLRAMPARSPYAAAKAALVSFTRDLAVAYGPQGIRANVLVPGFIDTPMSQRLVGGREPAARAEELRIPLRRIGRPEEVAGVARFLVSSQASYMNGSLAFVDGGLSLV